LETGNGLHLRFTKSAPLLFFSLALAFALPADCLAAAKKHAKRSGGGGSYSSGPGGVMLQTPEPHTAIEHNNRGVELGTKGLWADAIREHDAALQMDPYNKDFQTNLSAAHLRYGDVLAGKHDFYNAIKQYRHALFVDPNNAVADAHLDDCLTHLKKDPSDLKTRIRLAEDADVSQDYETAIVEYRKCVRMSDSGKMHAALGRCLLKAGKEVDGFAELKIAVAKSWEPKTDQELMRDLAATHRQMGDVLKEFAYKARDTGRGTVGMKRLLNAGIEYRRAVTVNQQDFDAARSLIEVTREAVAINPSFDNHLMLGGAYQLVGDFEHAKMEYEECWKADPRRPELAKAQKSYHLAVAKSPTATPSMVANTVEKVYKAVQKDPSDAEWWYVLGRAKETQYEKSGTQDDKDAALTAYQKAAAINKFINPDLEQGLRRLGGGGTEVSSTAVPGKTPRKEGGDGGQPATSGAPDKVDDTARKALAYAPIEKKLNAGDVDGAQKDLLAIVDKTPKDGRAWLLLGNTYEKKSDLDQAIVAYRQASLLQEPGASDALDGIATSRIAPLLQDVDKNMQANNMVQAAASLREAISIAPEKAMLYYKLADVLEKMGDKTEAEKMRKKGKKVESKDADSSKK
jgi:tetratricopeptide (TPR) repeat protein